MFHNPIYVPEPEKKFTNKSKKNNKNKETDNPKKLNKNEVAKKIKFNLDNIEKEENNAKAIFTRVEP
jgi:hypothetical protein